MFLVQRMDREEHGSLIPRAWPSPGGCEHLEHTSITKTLAFIFGDPQPGTRESWGETSATVGFSHLSLVLTHLPSQELFPTS